SGRTASPATACVAGIDAIATSAESVARGEAPVVVAGASETPFSPACVEAFRALGALATWPGRPEEASRPFDKLRSGLVLGEGAAIIVIEYESAAHARGSPIYGRIIGFAIITEGTNMRTADVT